MHERFLVQLQLCFVVSFVLRVEEGVIFSGKALGWTSGTLIWMPGARGKHTLYVCSPCLESVLAPVADLGIDPLPAVPVQAQQKQGLLCLVLWVLVQREAGMVRLLANEWLLVPLGVQISEMGIL